MVSIHAHPHVLIIVKEYFRPVSGLMSIIILLLTIQPSQVIRLSGEIYSLKTHLPLRGQCRLDAPTSRLISRANTVETPEICHVV
jgi:hypothetical protein